MARPEDKPMKKQWITVDGRTVPLVLPQVWDPVTEEWIVTSTDNPLNVNAQLTGSNIEIVERVFSTTLSAGSGNGTILQANLIEQGFKKFIVGVGLNEPAHDFDVLLSWEVSDFANRKRIISGEIIANVENEERGFVSEQLEIQSEIILLGLSNKDSSDHTYDIHLWGVK